MTPTRQTFGERCPATMYTDVSQLCVIIRNASNQICLVSSPTQPQYDLPYLQINDTVNDRHAVEELIRAELGVHCSLESEPFASTEEWKENIHQTCDYYLARMMPGDFSRSCTQRLVWTTVEGACDQLQAQGQERSACALSQLLNAQAPTPLAPMDPNARLAMAATAPSSFAEAVKPVPSFAQESQQHNYLHSKVLAQERSGQQRGTYVSPSDEIMSPASAKLNAVKERRFAKSAKPNKLLFAATRSAMPRDF